MLKLKYTIPLTILTSWTLLGFKRGINNYDYNYNRQNIYMKDDVDITKSQIRQPLIAYSNFVIHAMTFYTQSTSSRLQ